MKNSSSIYRRTTTMIAVVLLAALTGQAQTPSNSRIPAPTGTSLMQSTAGLVPSQVQQFSAATAATADGDKVIGSLKWEILKETTGEILARGNGPVRLKDMVVRDAIDSNGRRLTRKRIQLNSQFALEIADPPVLNITDKKGFGIAAQCADSSCFSWEWFSVQDSKHAFKSKGGALEIDLKQVGSDWEITQTNFKTDISLGISRIGVDSAGSKPYWRINISKGSQITWPSVVNGQVVPN
jgi:hypothetical protein